jgi:hypothetical protein
MGHEALTAQLEAEIEDVDEGKMASILGSTGRRKNATRLPAT